MSPGTIRSKLRFLSCAVLAIAACANVWRFTTHAIYFPKLGADDPVYWEERLAPIRDRLHAENYTRGAVGYMPASVFRGQPRTDADDRHWAIARYSMIPLNLVQSSDAPFVVLDAIGSSADPPVPGGFLEFYDPGNGLILLQKRQTQ